MQINEVKIQQILNPTSINLGEYVINPYSGCEYSCLYCYVRSCKAVSKKSKPWGEYVEVRTNAPMLLEKELLLKKPKTVLLGSTTECFQPIEKEFKLTQRILEILNERKIYFVILTRSPYILECLPLLKQGFCKNIYFTINDYNPEFKEKLEAKSPAFDMRIKAINALSKENLPVIPYFSPILPFVSDFKNIFNKFENINFIDFECLNFRLKNINDIVDNIASADPKLDERYKRMLNDRVFYMDVFINIKNEIEKSAKIANKKFNIHIHNFGDYFENKYEK